MNNRLHTEHNMTTPPEHRRLLRLLVLSMLLTLCLSLTACGKGKTPTMTADGQPWNPLWTSIGSLLGVEVPEGYTEERSEGIVTGSQTYYTVWAKGTPITYTNSEGTEITTYDRQIYLLAEESKSPEDAAAAAGSWQALADERYSYTDAFTDAYAGQEYGVKLFPFPEDGGPAAEGASATCVRGSWAIHVDVRTTDGEDPAVVLEDFLNHLHYAK